VWRPWFASVLPLQLAHRGHRRMPAAFGRSALRSHRHARASRSPQRGRTDTPCHAFP
jgi:hypothetical protein